MQFVYSLIIQEIRTKQAYEGNKVDLPSRGLGTFATNIWLLIKDPGDPGNAENDNVENWDNTAANFQIIFVDQKLPPLLRQKGDYEITRVELHKLIMKLKKNKIFEIAQILISAYWSVCLWSRICAVFLLVAWKNSMMLF